MGERGATIAVDAMGGDFAPTEVVRGALQASRDFGVRVVLVGDAKKIEPLTQDAQGADFRVVHAPETVDMGKAHPVEAVRRGAATSVSVAAQLVKDGEADGMVSAGSTGAAMAAALLRLGRVPGVERPAICTPMPTVSGLCFIVDAGANVDCRPAHLVQFAEMGAIYAEHIMGVERPRVALLNVGEEETKGSELTVKVHQLLRERLPGLNFIGNIEGRDIPWGKADVVVCDGFTGNVVLKFAEGMATALLSLLKEEITSAFLPRVGALLARPAFTRVKKRMDYTEYGGVPLLGVRGVCIIAHGSSNAKAIANAVRVAAEAAKRQAPALIAARLAEREQAVT